MEKLRRIIPVLLVLVLVLGIMIVPASADCPVVDGTCPCCGSTNITLDVVTTPEDDVITDFKCFSCCYEFIYFLGTDSYNEAGICTWEWCIDKENGNHYQYCSKCTYKKNEGPHFLKNCTRIEGTDTHQGTCTVCGAEVIMKCSGGSASCISEAVCEFCGQKYGDKNPALHDIQYHEAKPATCTEDGNNEYWSCADCGAFFGDSDGVTTIEEDSWIIEAKGHQWKPWVPQEDGKTHKHVCSVEGCGETETTPHEWGEWLSVDPYSHQRNCTMCGAFESEGHQYENGICTVCERKCTHEGGKATCVAKAVCDLCGLEYGNFDLTNHDLEHHDAKPATCTEIGWDAYDTCKREGCDYSTYEEIDKLGHDLEHHDAKPATCTEEGWPAYDTCKREGCDYTTLLVKQAKLGHDLVHHEARAATCTEPGWDAYDTCSRCDYSTYKEIPALGHDLVKHDAKAATCTEAGWDAYDSCSRCDYSTFKEIPALGHDIEHHAAKPATCTEDGWPAYDTCKREGCNYTTLLIMQARLGHDLTHHEGKAATCTEAGWEAYDTCKREGCDYTTYKEIPALGHDLTHHEGKAATCTEAGWDAYDTCSRCSYTTYREIAAPGHTPGEPVVTAREEPQVGKAGFEETIICCTVCGLELEYRYNQLPALPEPVPVPDTKEEGTGKPDAEIVIAPKKSVLRIIQPVFLEEEQELEHSVIHQIFSDDSGVYFQTEPDSVLPNIPPYALKLIEAKVWRLEKFSDLADRVSLDYTGSQEFPLNLDLIMILVYRDDAGEHWEVLKKPTRLIGNRLRAEVDASLVRKLQSRSFAIIVLADNGSR